MSSRKSTPDSLEDDDGRSDEEDVGEEVRDDEDEGVGAGRTVFAFSLCARFFAFARARVFFGPRGGRGSMDGSVGARGGCSSACVRARGGTRGWTRVDRRVKGLTANARGRRDSRATRRRKRRRRRSIEAFDSVRGGVGRRRYVIQIGARGCGSGRSIPRKRRRGRTTRRRDTFEDRTRRRIFSSRRGKNRRRSCFRSLPRAVEEVGVGGAAEAWTRDFLPPLWAAPGRRQEDRTC